MRVTARGKRPVAWFIASVAGSLISAGTDLQVKKCFLETRHDGSRVKGIRENYVVFEVGIDEFESLS